MEQGDRPIRASPRRRWARSSSRHRRAQDVLGPGAAGCDQPDPDDEQDLPERPPRSTPIGSAPTSWPSTRPRPGSAVSTAAVARGPASWAWTGAAEADPPPDVVVPRAEEVGERDAVPLGQRPGRGDAVEVGARPRCPPAAQGGGDVVAEPGGGGGRGEQPRRDRTVGGDPGERGGGMAACPQLVGDARRASASSRGPRRRRRAGGAIGTGPGDGDREQGSGQRPARACGEQPGDRAHHDGSAEPPRSRVARPWRRPEGGEAGGGDPVREAGQRRDSKKRAVLTTAPPCRVGEQLTERVAFGR